MAPRQPPIGHLSSTDVATSLCSLAGSTAVPTDSVPARLADTSSVCLSLMVSNQVQVDGCHSQSVRPAAVDAFDTILSFSTASSLMILGPRWR